MRRIRQIPRAAAAAVMSVFVALSGLLGMSGAQAEVIPVQLENIPPLCTNPAASITVSNGPYTGLERCGQYSAKLKFPWYTGEGEQLQVVVGSDYKIYEALCTWGQCHPWKWLGNGVANAHGGGVFVNGNGNDLKTIYLRVYGTDGKYYCANLADAHDGGVLDFDDPDDPYDWYLCGHQ